MFKLLFLGCVLCGCLPSVSSSASLHVLRQLHHDGEGSGGKPAFRAVLAAAAVKQVKKHKSSPLSPSSSSSSSLSFAKLPQLLASVFNCVMASLSLLLYLPIIVSLVQKGDASGVSVSTWATCCASFTLALIYPIKKKYPLGTYVELVELLAQSFVILFLTCLYNDQIKEFVLFAASLTSAATFVMKQDLSPRVLSSIQGVRLALDIYSLIPQIVLNFKNSQFSYSIITCSCSFAGNAMRAYTTLVLLKADPLVLLGYISGCLLNLFLIAQYFLYEKK